MCGESLCNVLGVGVAKAKAKRIEAARAKNMDIVEADQESRIADVKFMLQHAYAPEKVDDKDSNQHKSL